MSMYVNSYDSILARTPLPWSELYLVAREVKAMSLSQRPNCQILLGRPRFYS